MKKVLICLAALLLLALPLAACSKNTGTGGDSGVDMTVKTTGQYYTAEGEYADRFEYEYVNGDEVAITGFSASYVPHDVTVPSIIDERPVTEIAKRAFYNATNILSVTLPEGVRSVGDLAFANCSAMTKVVLPATVTTIGEAAFSDCTYLKEITLPAGLQKLGGKMFYNCKSLVTMTLPAAITVVPAQTFMSCERLKTVTLAEGTTEIGDSAFLCCPLLETVNLPETLSAIGDYAFAECPKFPTPTLPENVKLGTNVFYNKPQENACGSQRKDRGAACGRRPGLFDGKRGGAYRNIAVSLRLGMPQKTKARSAPSEKEASGAAV